MWKLWKMKRSIAQHHYVPHAFVKIEFSFSLFSSSLCFEAIFSQAVCSSAWIWFRWWNGDLSSPRSFLSSSFSSAFYSTPLPLQSSMLHGVLSNYANTALAGDQDSGGVTRPVLETALIPLVHCYQHTRVCVIIIFFCCSFFFKFLLCSPSGCI